MKRINFAGGHVFDTSEYKESSSLVCLFTLESDTKLHCCSVALLFQ